MLEFFGFQQCDYIHILPWSVMCFWFFILKQQTEISIVAQWSPEIDNKFKVCFFFLLTVFNLVFLGCTWLQSGQTDTRSRWHPDGCCWIGGHCPFTIHMASTLAHTVPETQDNEAHVATLEKLILNRFWPTIHFCCGSSSDRLGTSSCSKMHYCNTGVISCQQCLH